MDRIRPRRRSPHRLAIRHQGRHPDHDPSYAVYVYVYVDAIVANPRGLRVSFFYYRALDEKIAQNQQRGTTRVGEPDDRGPTARMQVRQPTRWAGGRLDGTHRGAGVGDSRTAQQHQHAIR